jgi:hypothetical protein
VSADEVRRNFECYGLLDEQVRFFEGFFQDTLASAPIERLAVLRLDGDMYESTIVARRALYPKVTPGRLRDRRRLRVDGTVPTRGARLQGRARHRRSDSRGGLDGRLLAAR